jgi:alpha-methylacyl-CoA racemase
MSPLASLKILDFTTLLPGPFATMFLADLGAEVLRIEAPNRPDLTRLMPPYEGNVSAWHAVLNRSKRSLALDLKQAEAAEIIKKLVQTYDIVIEQFRPGVMARLGVGYEALRQANPRLIYCSLTGYGQTGPYRDRAGHDLNYMALAGALSHTGRRGAGPLPLGVQVADIGAGSYNALVGILAAVIHRSVTGEGQAVDVAMYDGVLAWQATAVAEYLIGGQNPDYESWQLNGGSFYDCYATADGRYLAVGSLEPKFWQGFCQALGRPELISAGLTLDLSGMEGLKQEIRAEIGRKTLAEWQVIFAPLDVCVEPVQTIEEVVAHPHTAVRHLLVPVPKPDGSSQTQVANPLKFSRTPPTYKHIGRQLGEDTTAVLTELGYTPAQIAQWQADGVVV